MSDLIKHTPGPWKIDLCWSQTCGDTYGLNADAKKNPTDEEMGKNKILMEQSPEMVKALIRAAYRFRAMQKVKFAKLEYFNQIGHEMAEDLEKVIAEALGVECYHVYDGWRPAGYKDHYIETCIKCGFENEFEKDFT